MAFSSMLAVLVQLVILIFLARRYQQWHSRWWLLLRFRSWVLQECLDDGCSLDLVVGCGFYAVVRNVDASGECCSDIGFGVRVGNVGGVY